MKNYSRQREAVLRAVRSTDTHPTAGEVYEAVRETIPNISLGTVYRNLAELSGAGNILSLSVGDGFERFDGDCLPHLHMCCRKCGSIRDLPMKENPAAALAAGEGFTSELSVYIVYGLCRDCEPE